MVGPGRGAKAVLECSRPRPACVVVVVAVVVGVVVVVFVKKRD